jgi:hypothetical protein
MRVAEAAEANLQNIFGVVIAERRYKKYAKCVTEKHQGINILPVFLIVQIRDI